MTNYAELSKWAVMVSQEDFTLERRKDLIEWADVRLHDPLKSKVSGNGNIYYWILLVIIIIMILFYIILVYPSSPSVEEIEGTEGEVIEEIGEADEEEIVIV